MTRLHIDRLVIRLPGNAADARSYAAQLPEAIGRALRASRGLEGAGGSRRIETLQLPAARNRGEVAPAAAEAIARAARRRP